MLKGEKVCLVAIEEEDIEQLRNWRNFPGFRKHFREYREINKKMQRQWFERDVVENDRTIMFAVRNLVNQELLGCCGLCYINWVHRNADLSLYIGWKDAYIDDEGYAEEACNLLFIYGFRELGLKKIWTEIYEFDEKKLELYRNLGFHKDGILRKNYIYDGKWWDSYILSLLDEEF